MMPEQREAVRTAVAEALGEAYDCTRVWSAWCYNTMGPDDFSLVGEDSDRVAEIADAAIQAMPQQAAVMHWESSLDLPEVKQGEFKFFIVAVRRKHGGVHVYEAAYLNDAPLDYDGMEVRLTGWFSNERPDQDYVADFSSILQEGDVHLGWMPFPLPPVPEGGQ